MIVAHVTAFYAGILTLFYLVLALAVPRLRFRHKVGLGDGNQPELRRAIRIHANFAEYVPLALLLMMLVEEGGYSRWFLHLLGLTLIFARALHVYGLSRSEGHSPGRFLGTVLTVSVMGICSLLLLLNSLAVLFS